MGALDGIRVLDFSQVIFGPSCTQVLADHGADVIKVERPGQGDLARAFGPWMQEESLPYASLNRNKRSIALNLKQTEGVEVVHSLLERTDVLVHNFRPGVMERLDLSFEQLESRYSRLIYATGSGYGTSGPYAERNKGGHESMAQSLSGMAEKFRGPDGAPQRLPFTLSDLTGGMLLVQGILLALLARQRTGRGQALEIALLDGVMALQAWETTCLLNAEGWAQSREDVEGDFGAGGATHPRGNPLDGAVFRSADGYLMVTALFRPFDQLMSDLGEALELADLAADLRFENLDKAREHREALRAVLAPVFSRRRSVEWIPRLEAYDILCAPVRSTEEALEDPQLAVNGLIIEVDHPHLGRLRHVGTPLHLSATPAGPPRPAPLLGEHTRQVLSEAGYSVERVAELRQLGVVAWAESN